MGLEPSILFDREGSLIVLYGHFKQVNDNLRWLIAPRALHPFLRLIHGTIFHLTKTLPETNKTLWKMVVGRRSWPFEEPFSVSFREGIFHWSMKSGNHCMDTAWARMAENKWVSDVTIPISGVMGPLLTTSSFWAHFVVYLWPIQVKHHHRCFKKSATSQACHETAGRFVCLAGKSPFMTDVAATKQNHLGFAARLLCKLGGDVAGVVKQYLKLAAQGSGHAFVFRAAALKRMGVTVVCHELHSVLHGLQ